MLGSESDGSRRRSLIDNNINQAIWCRTCANCKTSRTPLWRRGPSGPKTLCNACGIRFKKEERRALSERKAKDREIAKGGGDDGGDDNGGGGGGDDNGGGGGGGNNEKKDGNDGKSNGGNMGGGSRGNNGNIDRKEIRGLFGYNFGYHSGYENECPVGQLRGQWGLKPVMAA